jgi:hypothetical protein
MTLSLRTANLLGAWLAEAFYVSAICIFIFRLIGIPEAGFWLGLFELSMAIPLVVLLRHAARFESPPLYYVQIVCMLLFLLVEAVLDYIYVVDFRQVPWAATVYTVLFFAASGGMLGIATYAGIAWRNLTVATFFVMAVLTFIQRAVMGY